MILQDLSRHEARTAETTPGRIGRGEQGGARPWNSVPRSGPQLVLSRRRLKTWSKSGLSIAETTGCTYLYVYFTMHVFTATASSSSGSPTTNASRRGTVCIHIVLAAATPYNSYVACNFNRKQHMLQQRQHQQYDQQQTVFSIICINYNSMLSLWAGTRYVSYSMRTECNSC